VMGYANKDKDRVHGVRLASPFGVVGSVQGYANKDK
jgi:hypothetical protein